MKQLLQAVCLVAGITLLSSCEQQGSAPDTTATTDTPAVAVATVAQDRGPHWQALDKINNPDNAFNVSAILLQQYTVGDALQFKVSSARDGYLHIVHIDSEDNVSTLLPHEAFADNKVEAGMEFTYPPSEGGIKIRAQEPLGESLVAFAVTRDDLPTEQVFPELFGKEGGKGLALITDDASGSGTAPWSIVKYTVNVAAGDQ